MSKLRPVKAEKVVKALSKLGFEIVRQKGSHLVMKHPDGRVKQRTPLQAAGYSF